MDLKTFYYMLIPKNLLIAINGKWIINMNTDELQETIGICNRRKYSINADLIKQVCIHRLNKLEESSEKQFQEKLRYNHDILLSRASMCHKKAEEKINNLSKVVEKILPFNLEKDMIMNSVNKIISQNKPKFQNQIIKSTNHEKINNINNIPILISELQE